MSPDLRPFRKSNLFSNHYLEKLIKDSPEWREAEPEQAFAEIKELYEREARVLENYNESQLEENFIRPVSRGCWGTTSECRERCWGRTGRRTTPSSWPPTKANGRPPALTTYQTLSYTLV